MAESSPQWQKAFAPNYITKMTTFPERRGRFVMKGAGKEVMAGLWAQVKQMTEEARLGYLSNLSPGGLCIVAFHSSARNQTQKTAIGNRLNRVCRPLGVSVEHRHEDPGPKSSPKSKLTSPAKRDEPDWTKMEMDIHIELKAIREREREANDGPNTGGDQNVVNHNEEEWDEWDEDLIITEPLNVGAD